MSHIHIQHYLTDEDKEIIIDCLKHGFPISMIIGNENSDRSLRDAYERGRKEGYTQGFRDATVLSKAHNNATVQSKDEDYRWNGGGNY